MSIRTRRAVLQGAAWLLLMLMATVLGSPAHAQTAWGEEYARRVRATEQTAALEDGAFGDKINLYNGTVTFSVTDISVPGNNALPVRLGRFFDPQDVSLPRYLGKWDLDIPNISAISPEGHDGGFPVPYSWNVGTAEQPVVFQKEWYWSGDRLNHPDGGGDILGGRDDPKRVSPTFLPNGRRTKDGWYFTGAALKRGRGTGYVGYAPDGTQYRFDWLVERDYSGISHPWRKVYVPATNVMYRKKLMLYVTEIKDRFGNWVRYEWDGDRPKRIYSNDGREIVLNVQVTGQTAYGRQIWSLISATSSGRTWTYNGSPSVINPDGTRWSYTHEGHRLDVISYEKIPGTNQASRNDEVPCSPATVMKAETAKYTIVHPSGAKAEFSFAPMRHGRTSVPYQCMGHLDEDAENFRNAFATYHDVWSLISKKISGVAMPEIRYSYSYQNLRQGYEPQDETAFPFYPGWNARYAPTDNAPKTVTVTDQDGKQVVHSFGKQLEKNEGQLQRVDTRKDGILYRSVQHEYVSEHEAEALPFPSSMGTTGVRYSDRLPNAIRPLKTTRIIEDGVTFTWSVANNCAGAVLCFDALARPTREVRSSTLGSSKTDGVEYFDQLSIWVIGQKLRTWTQGGSTLVEHGRTNYDQQTALPVRTYGPCAGACPGKLTQAMTYTLESPGDPQNGTLSTLRDGRGNVTTLANWRRGIPELIRHPATTDSPDGAAQVAKVNDDGSLAWVEDENGSRTCYQYDGMGRPERITYPSESHAHVCDSSKWFETSVRFEKRSEASYGIAAGHWRKTVATGNATKVTYFDAIWRPILEESYDAARPSATRSVTARQYGASGEVLFQSYAMRALQSYSDANNGEHTTYDALGRPVLSEHDSELGRLRTQTRYLDGFQVEVTDPRGAKSLTAYMAFDKPTREWPVRISQARGRPEEVRTDMLRDFMGRVISLRRSDLAGAVSATRTYSYDSDQRLCKTVEPETGATVSGYDPVGNVIWRASGLAANAPCDAEGDLPEILARRTVRTYDARNRVVAVAFPDGLGDQQLSYRPDSKVKSITTYNARLGQGAVVNAYAYNRRGQVIGESLSQPGKYTWSMGYGYNANGHASVSLTQPSGELIEYKPNALGQATVVASASAVYASDVAFHPNGTLAQFEYGNGIFHKLIQNERGLPKENLDILARDGQTVAVLRDTYDYDQNGNVVGITDGATGMAQRGNRSMEYDSLNRLLSAQSPMFMGAPNNTISYAYDALDNLLKVAGREGERHYCYDSSKRLTNLRTVACTSSTGTTIVGLGHDVQGNVTNKNGQEFVFDYGNRLRSAEGQGTYRYDGHGRRVQVSSAAGEILSHYGVDGMLRYQQDFRRKVILSYVYLQGRLVAVRESAMGGGASATRYQHTDLLGSPVVISNVHGVISERSQYEPYGALINRQHKDRAGYSGHVEDHGELIYMQQRYYDPQLGRFMSVDPVKTDTSTGAGINQYAYAVNNPYTFIDPDGRCETRSGSLICVRSLGPAGSAKAGDGALDSGVIRHSGEAWPAGSKQEVNAKDKSGEGSGYYNTCRGANCSRRHSGVDANGEDGVTKVYAFRDGKVVRADSSDSTGYGKQVVIQHADGVSTRYGHLHSYSVKVGDEVSQSQVIGLMGRTGNTPSLGDTHLHFEVLINDSPVDPLSHFPWLKIEAGQ